jgi:hypothetical protein
MTTTTMMPTTTKDPIKEVIKRNRRRLRNKTSGGDAT